MLKNLLFIWNSNSPGHPVFYLVTLHRNPWLELCPRTAWTNTLQCSSGSLRGWALADTSLTSCCLGLLSSLCPTSPNCGCALSLLPHSPTFQPHRLWCVTQFYRLYRENGGHLQLSSEHLTSAVRQQRPWIPSLCSQGGILTGPAPHRHPPPISAFPGVQPLLQATSQHHPNLCFFIIQSFSVFSHFFPILIISGGEVGIHFHNQKSLLEDRRLVS